MACRHCNNVQQGATPCNTLCNTVHHCASLCNTVQHCATLCNTVQHFATLCNTLQHAATHRLIHMCDMTHSNVWHNSFACVTLLIHVCDMTHSPIWCDSHMAGRYHLCCAYAKLTCTLRLATLCNTLQHSDSFVCVTWLIYSMSISPLPCTRSKNVTCNTL